MDLKSEKSVELNQREHGYNGKCQIEGCNRRATKNYSLCSKHDLQWKAALNC